jgi:hypothetical protein
MDGENPAVTSPTGDERVDDAVAALAALGEIPVEEHPAVLEEIHGRLGEILGEVEPGDNQSPT